MTFKIDYLDDGVYAWSIAAGGASVRRDAAYTPTIYVSAPSRDDLVDVAEFLETHPQVATTGVATRRTGWRHGAEDVLRLDVVDLAAVTDVAHEIRGWGRPGEYRLYNVDFSREFRYCLENDVVPVPEHPPTTCEIALPDKQVSDGDIDGVRVDGDRLSGTAAEILDRLRARLSTVDPDVLVLSTAELVPLLYERAAAVGVPEFDLGRRPGWQTLAAGSTYESYGRVGHSPARYNVPGRAIVDESNTFFWRQTNLDGVFDLVERSAKPLQETAWASIGNVLTAIQIREAKRRGVLVPWNSWRHERFKSAATLHEADRGGFIFSPDVGLHEDVHELDFSSLYPNVIRTRNVSPETVRCDCHSDRNDVPGLGYSICDDPGYLPDVLGPIIDDREDYKTALRRTDDPERAADLRGRSEALKWILVSCFGYQGFSNAKFGRIECHEAINAFAREILLETKEILEANGWRVVHGIVDSIWVQAVDGEEQAPLSALCDEITAAIEIPLEYEARYEWIAFVPRVDSDAGALNRYFAKVAGGDGFKTRGIEVRQRSTPAFVEDCQMDLLRTLDATRDPEAVCDRLQQHVDALADGAVPAEDLLIRNRVSKRLAEYAQYTHNVAALERAADRDFAVEPGEDVRYVVVDDDKESRARVRLDFEDLDTYDAEYYTTLLVRAAENVLSPVGWDRRRIRRYLAETRDSTLAAFGVQQE